MRRRGLVCRLARCCSGGCPSAMKRSLPVMAVDSFSMSASFSMTQTSCRTSSFSVVPWKVGGALLMYVESR